MLTQTKIGFARVRTLETRHARERESDWYAMNASEARIEHCCACARAEDSRELLGIAAGFLQDARPGEVRDAAEALLLAAFKGEHAKYLTAGLPRFDAQ